jgi:hypothetical protein
MKLFSRNAAFTAVPILLSDQRLYIMKNMCVYIYTHISECVQTVYELPLLPNKTAVKHFCTNRERCEVLTEYLSLGRRPGGDWANM